MLRTFLDLQLRNDMKQGDDTLNPPLHLTLIIRDVGGDEGALTWDTLQTLLCREGESMAMNNIDNDLTSLLGVGEEKMDGSTPFGYQNFAEDILGFES